MPVLSALRPVLRCALPVASAISLCAMPATAESIMWDQGNQEPDVSTVTDTGQAAETFTDSDVWTPTGSVNDWGMPSDCWYANCHTEGLDCLHTEGCKELVACSKVLKDSTCQGTFSLEAQAAHLAYMTCGYDKCGPLKVDACEGRCGSYYGGFVLCECDKDCSTRGDCCKDLATTCEPEVDVTASEDVQADAGDPGVDVTAADQMHVDATDARDGTDNTGLLLDADASQGGTVVDGPDRNACQAQRTPGRGLWMLGILPLVLWRRRARHDGARKKAN
jgi:hypothetical protein